MVGISQNLLLTSIFLHWPFSIICYLVSNHGTQSADTLIGSWEKCFETQTDPQETPIFTTRLGEHYGSDADLDDWERVEMMLGLEEQSKSDEHRSEVCDSLDADLVLDHREPLPSRKQTPTISDSVGTMSPAESDGLIDRFGGSSLKLKEYHASIGLLESDIGQQTPKIPAESYQVADKFGGADARMQEYYTAIVRLNFPNTPKYGQLTRAIFFKAMSRSGVKLTEKGIPPKFRLPTPPLLQKIMSGIPEIQVERREKVKERFKQLLFDLSLKFSIFFLIMTDPKSSLDKIVEEQAKMLRWLLEGVQEAQKAPGCQNFDAASAESSLWRGNSVITYFLLDEGKTYPRGERSILTIRIQLVMNLLTIYLKSFNLSKWNLIFGDLSNDYFNFVDVFLTLRKMEEDQSGSLNAKKISFTLQRQRRYIVKELQLELLPWESPALTAGSKWPPNADRKIIKQGIWRWQALEAEHFFDETVQKKKKKIGSQREDAVTDFLEEGTVRFKLMNHANKNTMKLQPERNKDHE